MENHFCPEVKFIEISFGDCIASKNVSIAHFLRQFLGRVLEIGCVLTYNEIEFRVTKLTTFESGEASAGFISKRSQLLIFNGIIKSPLAIDILQLHAIPERTKSKLQFLLRATLVDRRSKDAVNSLLLCGRNGCGRTSLIRSLLSSIDSTEIRLDLLQLLDPRHCNEPTTKSYACCSEQQRIRLRFNEAILKSPSVLILDRYDVYPPALRMIVAEGIKHLKGIGASVIVIAKSCQRMDEAVFEEIVEFSEVGFSDRINLLKEIVLHSKDTHSTDLSRSNIDYDCWANSLAGMSSGEVIKLTKNMINRSAASAVVNESCPDSKVFAITAKNLLHAAYTLTETAPAMEIPILSAGQDSRLDLPLNNVYGAAALREELVESICWPRKHHKIFEEFGITPEIGILLYGPPGSGKTLVVAKLAAELKCTFIVVTIPDLIRGTVGTGERALRESFQEARRKAPAIIFFDEFQAIFTARQNDTSGDTVGSSLTSALSSCFDDVAAWNRHAGADSLISVIGATNEPWAVDSGFLRPGRLDRICYVGPLGKEDRRQFLWDWYEETAKKLAISMPSDNSIEHICDEISERTQLFTGSDMEFLVHQACRNFIATGRTRDPHGPLDDLKLPSLKDFVSSLKVVHASCSSSEDNETIKRQMKQGESVISIIIRPVDNGWVMGEDLPLNVSSQMTSRELMKYIQQIRGISEHRQQFRMKDGKVVLPSRESWAFRRFAMTDGYVIQVEPTLSGSWYWNDREYYVNKVFDEVNRYIDESKEKRVEIQKLSTMVTCPPPIKSSLRVLLRQYPERFHLNCDVTNGYLWVERVQYDLQLPSFGQIPVQLGSMPIFVPEPFDWEAYKDIDDTKKIEVEFEIPDVSYEVAILSAADLARVTPMEAPNPFAVTYFNGKLVGKTAVRMSTENPVWRDELIVVSISASMELRDCVLLVEMWDMDMSTEEPGVPGTFLGCAEVRGIELDYLLGIGKSMKKEFPLVERMTESVDDESSTNDLESATAFTTASAMKISGTVTIRGGRGGFEVQMYSAKNLVELPDLTCKPFAVLFWNNEFLGKTLPARKNQRNPIYDEVFPLPPLLKNRPLEDCQLEIQMWSAAPGEHSETKSIFMGATIFNKEALVRFLTSSSPYACRVRKDLGKSTFKIPQDQRKNPIDGLVVAIGGNSGLLPKPGRIVELQALVASKLAKVRDCFLLVEWNMIQQGEEADHRPVVPINDVSTAVLNQKFFFETENGDQSVAKCSLKFEMWEWNPSSRIGQAYLGMVMVDKQELIEMFDGKFAVSKTVYLDRNPNKPAKEQSLVRGQITLRAGTPGARMESERILIIKAAKNLLGSESSTMKKSRSRFGSTLLTRRMSSPVLLPKADNTFLPVQAIGSDPPSSDGRASPKSPSRQALSVDGSIESGRSSPSPPRPAGISNQVSGIGKIRQSLLKNVSTFFHRDTILSKAEGSQGTENGQERVSKGPTVYVTVKWNSLETGRTTAVPKKDFVILDSLLYITYPAPSIDPKAPPHSISIELWENPDNGVNESKDVLLGGLYMLQDEIASVLEAETPFESYYPLMTGKKSNRTPTGMELLLFTPGLKYASMEELRLEKEGEVLRRHGECFKMKSEDERSAQAWAEVARLEEEERLRLFREAQELAEREARIKQEEDEKAAKEVEEREEQERAAREHEERLEAEKLAEELHKMQSQKDQRNKRKQKKMRSRSGKGEEEDHEEDEEGDDDIIEFYPEPVFLADDLDDVVVAKVVECLVVRVLNALEPIRRKRLPVIEEEVLLYPEPEFLEGDSDTVTVQKVIECLIVRILNEFEPIRKNKSNREEEPMFSDLDSDDVVVLKMVECLVVRVINKQQVEENFQTTSNAFRSTDASNRASSAQNRDETFELSDGKDVLHVSPSGGASVENLSQVSNPEFLAQQSENIPVFEVSDAVYSETVRSDAVD